MKSLLSLALFGLSVALAVDPVVGLPEPVAQVHRETARDLCETDTTSPAQIHDLGDGHRLYLVPCHRTPYQWASRAYVTMGGRPGVRQIPILGFDESTGSVVATLDLFEPIFDSANRSVSSVLLGRGSGDCGQSSLSEIRVDEKNFTAYAVTRWVSAKPNCDGNTAPWPLVFQQ